MKGLAVESWGALPRLMEWKDWKGIRTRQEKRA